MIIVELKLAKISLGAIVDSFLSYYTFANFLNFHLDDNKESSYKNDVFFNLALT